MRVTLPATNVGFRTLASGATAHRRGTLGARQVPARPLRSGRRTSPPSGAPPIDGPPALPPLPRRERAGVRVTLPATNVGFRTLASGATAHRRGTLGARQVPARPLRSGRRTSPPSGAPPIDGPPALPPLPRRERAGVRVTLPATNFGFRTLASGAGLPLPLTPSRTGGVPEAQASHSRTTPSALSGSR